MAKEFNPDLVVFGKPQKEDTYYRSPMSIGQESVILQTPQLILASREGTLIELVLGDRSVKSLRFYEQIAKLDDFAMRTLAKESEVWFQKKIPIDKLKTMYQPCISPTQVPTVNQFRFRLAKNLRVFRDSQQDEISLDELISMAPYRISCILRFEGILIAGGKARLDIRVAQILTHKSKESPVEVPKTEEREDGYDSDIQYTFPEPSQDPIVIDTPKEPPKVEPPKVEPPKVEPPKEEPPKEEPPKEEPPKEEPPKEEPPKKEQIADSEEVTKRELADALAKGDYGRVATLAAILRKENIGTA